MNALRAIVRDQISDYRITLQRINDGTAVECGHNIASEYDYAEKCKVQVGVIYRNRHTARLDRYGWPSGILA